MDLDIRPMMVATEGLRGHDQPLPYRSWTHRPRRKPAAAGTLVLASWITAIAATGGLVWAWRAQQSRSAQPSHR